MHLARYARQVTLLIRSDALAASMSRYLIREIETAPDSDVRYRTEVTGGDGDGRLEQLTLRHRDAGQTQAEPADGLFVLIGAQPFTGWLPETIKRDQWGFILTGPDTGQDWPLKRAPFLLETTTPGVFAAGDVRHGSMKRVASAVGGPTVHETTTRPASPRRTQARRGTYPPFPNQRKVTKGNAMNVRDAFYEVLRAHGITTIFGNPGSNELPLLSDLPDDFRYILALQEGAAIGMADGFAQATGRPALVNLHAAAGTGNAMGNLVNTQAGHVPVIVTSGQQARRYTELKAYLTNVDAPKLVEPLVKWSHEPARPQDAPQSLSKAILLATAAPTGPVYLSLPLDDWDHDADASALGQLKSRAVDGNPVVSEEALGRLRERLAAALNPVMVAGPDIDTPAGWDGAVRLAEKLSLPVLVAPSPARCPFPTRHPNFRGVLPASIPAVASGFDGHDLIVAFGAPIFRYHEFADGDHLPAGAELWAVTSDPDEAARAPVGHILIGDPADAVERLADTIPGAGRPPLPAREPLPQADTTGPAFTEEAIMDAVNAATTDSTVIAHEWTSTMASVWDRLEITRPGSLYLSAAGGLGWGLPGAIGLQLGNPTRRVVALLGDGSVHYSVSGLWTAAQHHIPVVFVVARNSEYRALKEFSRFMHAPGMELPGMDIPGIAASYGVPSERVKTLSDLTRAVKDALTSDQPYLIEVPERRLAST